MPSRASARQRRAEILRGALEVATESGLDAVTVRGVAEKSGISAGLVLFHFGTRARLVHALLDRILDECLRIPPPVASAEGAYDTLARLVDSETSRLEVRVRLADVFFEFWVVGLREPAIRRRMRAALRAYREAFEPLASAAIRERRDLFRGVSAEGLATVAVAVVQGIVLQASLDPGRVDVGASQCAFQALSRALEARRRPRAVGRPSREAHA